MTTNRWRGDAPTRPKKLTVYEPANSGSGTRVTFTVGNKSLAFDGWSSSEIVTAINAAAFPELDDVTVSQNGQHIQFTGIDDEDFDVNFEVSPTVEFELDQGRPVIDQQTRLSFSGATGGTFTLTCNGETTSSITLKTSGTLNTGGVVSAIEALTSFTSGDVAAVVSGSDIVLTWSGNYAGKPVVVAMNTNGLNNGGQVVISEKQAARPATHDMWALASDADFEFSISDGTTAVVLLTNETDEQIAEKLSQAWGGQVNVYSDTVGTSTEIRDRVWLLDMVGFPGTTTTLTVSSISPVASPIGVAVEKLVDRTDTTPSEIFLIDTREGSVTLTYGENSITVTGAGSQTNDVLAALNAGKQFSQWAFSELIVTSGDLGGPGGTSKLALLTNNTIESRLSATNGGEDFPETELTFDGDGTVLHLQHGGSTNAAEPAKHAWYLAPLKGGNTLSGSYSLEFPEGLATFAHNDSAATVKSTVETAIGYTVAVTGTGTPTDPYVISYTTDSSDRALPILDSKSFTGDGRGVVSTPRSAQTGKSATQIVRVAPFATSGTYELQYGAGGGPVQFDYDETAVDFKSKLETYPELSTSADTAVSFNADSGEYRITFQNGLANQEVKGFSLRTNSLQNSSGGTVVKTIDQYATGPQNFAEPLNWSLGYVPNSGEEIVIDNSRNPISYGLRQFVEVTIDTSTNTLTATGGHDLTAGQIVKFVFGTTGPTGLSESTSYYVTNVDHVAGTFTVSTTENGPRGNITAAGTGPHWCGLMPSSVLVPASMTAPIGLRRENANLFSEYRPQFLSLGVPADQQIEIGKGTGNGSGLLRIKTGNSPGQLTVYRTNTSSIAGQPALLWDAVTDDGTLLVHDGSVGIAVYDDEVCKVGAFNVLGGDLKIGSATIVGNAISVAGSLQVQRASIEGLLRIT